MTREQMAREYVESQLDEFSLKHLVGTPFTEDELRRMIASDYLAGFEACEKQYEGRIKRLEKVIELLKGGNHHAANEVLKEGGK
jgi:hypothetical protein